MKNVFLKAVNSDSKEIIKCVDTVDFLSSTLSKYMSILACLYCGDVGYCNVGETLCDKDFLCRFTWLNQNYLPGTFTCFWTMYTVVVTLSEPDGPTWAHMPWLQEKSRQLIVSTHQMLHDPSRLPTVDGACCCRNGGGSTVRSESSTKSQEQQTRPWQLDQISTPTSADRADKLFTISGAQYDAIQTLSKKTHHG